MSWLVRWPTLEWTMKMMTMPKSAMTVESLTVFYVTFEERAFTPRLLFREIRASDYTHTDLIDHHS
jgi:hypothetical protein